MRIIGLFIFFMSLLNCMAQPIQGYIPTDSLKGCYLMMQNAADSSGNMYDGVINGTPTTTLDYHFQSQSAYYFNGVVDYINCGDIDAFEGMSTWSCSFYIKPDQFGDTTLSGKLPIISKWASFGDVSNSSFLITLEKISNVPNMIFYFSDGTQMDSVRLNAYEMILAPNDWSDVKITFDNGNVSVYNFGLLKKQKTLAITTINNSVSDFKIADWYFSVNPGYSTFIGVIDDVIIYNRVVSDCDIQDLSWWQENVTGIVNVNNGTYIPNYGNSIANYIWLDCNDSMNVIPGETSTTFTPTQNGNYACQITYLGCTDTTNCVVINNVGMNELNTDNISLYPNPAINFVNLDLLDELGELYIISMDGKMVKSLRVNSNRKIDIHDLDKGIYLFKVIINDKEVVCKKVLKN